MIAEACVAHRRIAEAIQAGDEDCAAQAAEFHLSEVEHSMIARMV